MNQNPENTSPSARPERTQTVINHQTRATLEIKPVRSVQALLKNLALDPDTVLVIQGDRLLCDDDPVDPDHPVEVRPVISGGSGARTSPGKTSGSSTGDRS